tara:strand:- start:3107 stop:4528 length:1422 start_codon:yes stop_codon:yes gene_type:complete
MLVDKFKLAYKRWVDAQDYRQYIPTDMNIHDAGLKDFFCSTLDFRERVNYLTMYFVTSWVKHANKKYTRCYYSGAFSYNDRDMDAIEGCTRMLPFIASVITSKQLQINRTLDGDKIDLKDMLLTSLLYGTDPESKYFWGDGEDYSQLICEAADVALAVWIVRDEVLPLMSNKQKRNLFLWLRKCGECKTVDNNWLVFQYTIQAVLEQLDVGYKASSQGYLRIKGFYVGDGWFTDGEGQNFDYYNAWAFHYSLYWLDQISPNLDPDFIRSSNAQFCDGFKYFFCPTGMPFFGRSLCYRMAAPAPLIASVLMGIKVISAGEAKRAFDQTWKFFIANNAISGGVPTQGYFESDMRFCDEYTGPGSSLWGLRSLILLLQASLDSELFDAEDELLPVEKGNFIKGIKSISLKLEGVKKSGAVSATWLNRPNSCNTHVEKYGWNLQLKEVISQKPHRPKNHNVKNALKQYLSMKPYSSM